MLQIKNAIMESIGEALENAYPMDEEGLLLAARQRARVKLGSFNVMIDENDVKGELESMKLDNNVRWLTVTKLVAQGNARNNARSFLTTETLFFPKECSLSIGSSNKEEQA